MIKILYNSTKNRKFKELKEARKGAWIFVEDPSDKEVSGLIEKFNLEEDYLEDALDPHEVPRVEVKDSITYIFLRTPKKENNKIVTKPLLIAIGENFFLTLSRESLPVLEKFSQGKEDFLTTQKTKFFLQIFAEISRSYNAHLSVIRKGIRATAGGLGKVSNKNIIALVQTEEFLDDFMSSLVAMDAMIEKVIGGKFLRLYEDDADLMEDIALDNQQLIVLCRSSIKSISSIRGAYATIMTNNLNSVIRLLTALTILLTVPTIIFSFWGMNVALPFEETSDGFILILALTGSISGVILLFFAYKKWL